MSTGGGWLIATEGLTKVYTGRGSDRVVALDGVRLRVARGELLALSGPSGSGKTSLLSVLGCMVRPTAGEVLVEGRNVAKLSEDALTHVRRATFGFIFQRFHLLPGVSVLENVMLPLIPTAVGRGEMRRRAEAALASLGLGGMARRDVVRLSGGEQQRVAIARALVNRPAVLLADEPTAHLDRTLSLELMAILAELNRQGCTVLVASHDPLVVAHPAVSRAVALRDGCLVDEVAA